jgi:hypothetical protein
MNTKVTKYTYDNNTFVYLLKTFLRFLIKYIRDIKTVFRVSPQTPLKHVSLRLFSEIQSEIRVGLHVNSLLNMSGLNEDLSCITNFREALQHKIS